MLWHRCGKMRKWKNGKMWKICLACRRGKFFLPHVSTLKNAPIFVEHINAGEKHEEIFDPLTRPPSWPSAAGPSICHLSLSLDGGGGH